MKWILAIMVPSILVLVLPLGHAYAPCIEGPGINCNNYPPPTISQIKTDKINYKTSDKPVITIIGVPTISVHLEVDDVNSNVMFSHELILSTYGNATLVIDTSSYKPGVYSVSATSLMSKIQTSFSVGLEPTGNFLNYTKTNQTNSTGESFHKYCCGQMVTIRLTDAPLKQIREGTGLNDIYCNDGFYLAVKNDHTPVCLKAGTISKLAPRGFFYDIPANESKIHYTTVLIPPGSENQASSNKYSPVATTVVIGVNNTVQWVNQAITGNTLVADRMFEQDGKSFGSPTLRPGQSYEFTFTEPGTYAYHGVPHPWQRGSIIVK